jgi:hypothetical protein
MSQNGFDALATSILPIHEFQDHKCVQTSSISRITDYYASR